MKVTPITATRQATPDLRWNLRLISGWNRDLELAPVALVTNNISATVPTRHSAFTDVSYFLPHARLQVLTVNNPSITTLQSGFLSAGLLIDFWGV